MANSRQIRFLYAPLYDMIIGDNPERSWLWVRRRPP